MLLSSSNPKCPTFPLFSYFSVVVCLICLLHHILSLIVYTFRKKNGNLFSLALCSLWWVQIVGYVLACGSYSFVCTLHHLNIIIVQTLSVDIELIKCLVRYNLSSVCVRLSIFSQLSVIHCTICGAVCFQFTNFLCDDWDDIYTLSYYHHQIGRMFRVRSWNIGMRCMSFYILLICTHI